MLRAFATHKYRKTEELSEKFWDFSMEQEDGLKESRKMWVPGCWESCPGLENYRGIGQYQTAFEAEGNVRIVFKGVSHFAKVYIDDVLVGEHYGSYTPFEVYGKDLHFGVHNLRVEVDNSFSEKYALDIPNDYYSYGGISRGVGLEFLPDVFLQWIHVTPLQEQNGVWDVKVEVMCANLSEQEQHFDLDVQIPNEALVEKDCVLPVHEERVYTFETKMEHAQSWSPEHPVLYMVTARIRKDGVVTDDLVDRFGLRLVRVEGNQILLNGKALRIKGFCRHEDHPEYGCALPAAEMQRDLQLMKDMGANSVRTSHYPNDERFLDYCDELGILVWEENHARGLEVEQMQNPLFEEQCEKVISEMITAHYNHPSIYIWGILNECGSETEYGRMCYKAQYKKIASLDKSRPYSSASCKYEKDICQDLEMVCSWNMYPYWYEEDTATQRLTKLHEWLQQSQRGAGKPLLVTEIGAGGIYGFRSVAQDVWSEELQSEILGKQLSEVAAFENCSGMYIWQFCDVRVSKEWAMRRPKSRNNKGIVDEYRRPKLAYETVKKIFTALPNYR